MRGLRVLACQTFLAQAARLLRLPVADAEPAGDDHPLDVGRATWMLLHDATPLLCLGYAADRAQDGIEVSAAGPRRSSTALVSQRFVVLRR